MAITINRVVYYLSLVRFIARLAAMKTRRLMPESIDDIREYSETPYRNKCFSPVPGVILPPNKFKIHLLTVIASLITAPMTSKQTERSESYVEAQYTQYIWCNF